MKILILSILLVSFSVLAEDSVVPTDSEASVNARCSDGACINPNASPICLTCDSQVREVTPVTTDSEGTK